jgi:hypothetical protein
MASVPTGGISLKQRASLLKEPGFERKNAWQFVNLRI